MNPNSNAIELAPDWPIKRVEASLISRDTCGLFEFLRNRHENRFFEPIDYLGKAVASHIGYGFSMMSLCCLLVETFQCYRDGVPTTNKSEWKRLLDIQNTEPTPSMYKLQGKVPPINGEAAFKNFFNENSRQFPDLDGVGFYKNIRNGLLHQAQTKGGWRINIKHSEVWDAKSKSINRNLFAQALKKSFDSYLNDLKAKPWDDPLWENAARKSWWLIRVSE